MQTEETPEQPDTPDVPDTPEDTPEDTTPAGDTTASVVTPRDDQGSEADLEVQPAEE